MATQPPFLLPALAPSRDGAQNDLVSATVENIVEQVRALTPAVQEELWQLLAADQSKNLDAWEKQVAADSSSGKLDHLLAELTDDIAAAPRQTSCSDASCGIQASSPP